MNRAEEQEQAMEEDRGDRLGIVAKAFFVAIIVATILNGSLFWLKRVGWLEPELRETYYTKYHHDRNYVVSPEELKEVYDFRSRLITPQGMEILFKLVKDGVSLFFLLVSGWLLLRHRELRGILRYRWFFFAFFAVLGWGLVTSLVNFGPLVPLAGIRSYLFLFVCLFGGWAATRQSFAFLATCLFVLMLVQLALLPIELWRGIHLYYAKFFGTNLGDRVVGTMVLPNSLGILAVLSLCFYYCFGDSRVGLRLLAGVVVILVYFCSSATAWILFCVFGLGVLYKWIPSRLAPLARLGGIALLGGVVWLLPEIVGRYDIFDSLWGRLYVFQKYISSPVTVTQVFLGKGLGVGTNGYNSLVAYAQQNQLACLEYIPGTSADSTPMLLLHQGGLVGVLMFYGLIFWAARQDTQLRLLYLLLLIGSMTVNILEYFPVNILLGLLLARSLHLPIPAHHSSV